MFARKFRPIFCVSLLILVTGVPLRLEHFSRLQSICAKELRNQTTFDKGLVEITLKLEGETAPGKPKVVPAEDTFHALHDKTNGTSLVLKETGENIWTCSAVDGKAYVIGWIAETGWFAKRSRMFGYCSNPFTAHQGLTVEFSPSMPAIFEYDLRNPPEGVKAMPAKVLLLREIIKNGQRTFFSWGGKQEINRPGILKITGLAAGKYQISARTSDTDKSLSTRTPFLYENREIEIQAGKVNRFDPNYPVIDSTVEVGDVTIRGTLYGPNKNPLPNKTVFVIPLTSHGYDLSLYYPPSTTDSNGRFEFVGVRPNRLVYISSENTSINIGKQSLIENASITTDIVLGLKKLPIVVGNPLEQIVITWKGGNKVRLSDLAGKTVVLDVWATWCAPCIRALPELNALAQKISDEHNTFFVALSIDHDKAIWEKMVQESDWHALKHGILDRTKNSYDFNRPIPYSMVIDKSGVVRAQGNGLDIGLELEKIARGSSQQKPKAPALSTQN